MLVPQLWTPVEEESLKVNLSVARITFSSSIVHCTGLFLPIVHGPSSQIMPFCVLRFFFQNIMKDSSHNVPNNNTSNRTQYGVSSCSLTMHPEVWLLGLPYRPRVSVWTPYIAFFDEQMLQSEG